MKNEQDEYLQKLTTMYTAQTLAEWINKEWSRLGGRKTESRNLSTLEILLFPFLIPLCLFLESSSSEPPEEVYDEEEWEEEEEWYEYGE